MEMVQDFNWEDDFTQTTRELHGKTKKTNFCLFLFLRLVRSSQSQYFLPGTLLVVLLDWYMGDILLQFHQFIASL